MGWIHIWMTNSKVNMWVLNTQLYSNYQLLPFIWECWKSTLAKINTDIDVFGKSEREKC